MIYMVYTDYIPGPRRGSAAAGESRCNEIIAFGMEVYSRYIPGMCKNLEYVRHIPDIIVCLTYYDTILYGFQMTWGRTLLSDSEALESELCQWISRAGRGGRASVQVQVTAFVAAASAIMIEAMAVHWHWQV
jgi:hypothetical protein